MNWFKIASIKEIEDRIKKILKSHSFTKSIMDYYNIPIEDIDSHLAIEVCNLDGKFAEGNGKLIRIDRKLLKKDFFKENFHFIIHEFFHWVKRRSEAKFYFNDPEEVQSFVMQMTWDLIQGQDREEVIKKIQPIIQTHFKDQMKFKNVFEEMVKKAIYLYEIYLKNETIDFN